MSTEFDSAEFDPAEIDHDATGAARSFLADDDLSSAEQRAVLELAATLKADRHARTPYAGPRSVAIIFDKPTLRTQVSFTTAVAELGGYPLMVDGALAQIGRRESVSDVARVLGRQVSAIVWRTFHQSDLEAMAADSGVPVVNALTDDYHPCQGLADLLTIAEHTGGLSASGPALAGRVLAYVGDGSNNMAHSYLLAGALAGMDVHLGCPEGYGPRPDVIARAQRIAAETGAAIGVHADPRHAVVGADAVATDTWVSMGQEAESGEREGVFLPYQLDQDLLDLADPAAVVLHCLPAYRGKEITAEVLDGPRAVVWDEAENRLHAQKAVLTFLAEHRREP
ncbi:ornithine carbamoyltransferase [Litorihabitans aurantiacus]|uniref:Ornithine carbamoyltransferase n=1 Tax=Litorihabitans aurantiacus TaxID=1930061 RepID=A0AA38CR46_9MICO|nr:ornithine carbamoyltransferase [Litorihabitans aurantiacus]GMA31661.1 ornithine carbamoyltransferase, catabolic [Litorihabitans aurantiacus]